jgi:hypothetical protein
MGGRTFSAKTKHNKGTPPDVWAAFLFASRWGTISVVNTFTPTEKWLGAN